MAKKKSKQKSTKRNARKSRSSTSSPRVGPAFDKLVAVMARLRAPNGCPWDREQTHVTLRTYLIEEAYEVLDALDSTDDAKFAEELGDLLLQVLFHAQIAREEGRFAINDVIREIYEKMIRRHPHVFGDTRAKTAADVLRNWEIIKKEEREAKQRGAEDAKETREVKEKKRFRPTPSPTSSTSLLDGVPRSLPALLEAFQLTRKAARIGFDWYDINGIFAKLDEETHELRHALASSSQPIIPSEARNLSSSFDFPAGAPRDGFARGTSGTGGRSLPVQAGFSSDNKPSAATGPSGPEELISSSIESELGDILFVAVNLARFLHVDPEIALKKANAKFSRRFREMERLAREQGTTLAQVPRPQMESLWDRAKLRVL